MIVDNSKFPLLIIDDFLSPFELEIINNEIEVECLKAYNQDEPEKNLERVHLDMVYKDHREDSNILGIIQRNLFSPKMLDIYNTINDTAFRAISQSNYHETQLSFYGNTQKYDWHSDNIHGRLINYVLFIDMGGDFSGGESLISYDELSDKAIAHVKSPPKNNTLIMMPAWVTHAVAPVKSNSNMILDGRITVNGHIGFQMPSKNNT